MLIGRNAPDNLEIVGLSRRRKEKPLSPFLPFLLNSSFPHVPLKDGSLDYCVFHLKGNWISYWATDRNYMEICWRIASRFLNPLPALIPLLLELSRQICRNRKWLIMNSQKISQDQWHFFICNWLSEIVILNSPL